MKWQHYFPFFAPYLLIVRFTKNAKGFLTTTRSWHTFVEKHVFNEHLQEYKEVGEENKIKKAWVEDGERMPMERK